MKAFVSILLSMFVCIASVSYAQLSKDEKKEWKKRAKEYKKNPEALKNLVEEHGALSSRVSSLDQQVKNLQSEAADKDAKISELQDDLNRARSALAAAQDDMRKLKAEYESSPKKNTNWDKGLVFKVQIGAFTNKDLQKFFDNHPNFGGEVREDGTQAITLGVFRDYWDADTFKKYLREMGVSDAWIVAYQDAQRVDLKEVLEGIGEKPAPSG